MTTRDKQCLRIHLPGVAIPQMRCRCSLALFPLVTAHSEVIVPTPTQWTRHLALHRSARREGNRDLPEARFEDANPDSGRLAAHQWSTGYRHSLGDFSLLTPGRNQSTDSKDRFFQKRAQYPWRDVELAWAHPTILDCSE